MRLSARPNVSRISVDRREVHCLQTGTDELLTLSFRYVTLSVRDSARKSNGSLSQVIVVVFRIRTRPEPGQNWDR